MSGGTPVGPDARRAPGGLASLLGVLLFVAALVVLYRELAAQSYAEVVGALHALPTGALLGALALVLVAFLVGFAQEALALQYVDQPLGARRAAFASFLGSAFSQTGGTPLLTGAPVRHRLYAAWEIPTGRIERIVAFYAATSWVGLLAVVGAGLVLLPTGLASGLPVPGPALRILGLCAVALVVAYLTWTLLARRPLVLLWREVPAPSPKLALGQVVTGAADWLVGAGVLYALLPSGHGLSFLHLAVVYGLALALGQASLVPAGLGVFEAALLIALPESVPRAGLVASLVAYRGIHSLLPLLIAGAALFVHELRRRREAVERTVDALGRGLSLVVPLLLSALVFVAGVSLLLTGALPTAEGGIAWLRRVLPLPVIELSHFLGSVIGAGLLILARGLRQRLDAAYRLTVALLVAGIAVSSVRGFGWVEAGGLLVVLAVLLPARREFFRKAGVAADLPSWRWTALVGIALAATGWLGLFVYRQVDLTAELWWEFTLRGDAPRFLRASVGVGVVLLGYGLARLLRPRVPEELAEPPEEPPPEVDAVVAGSDRAHAALVYLADKQVLLSRSGRAFVMYAVEGRSWISLGDPLGEDDDRDELVWRFRELAHRYGGWPVFYQARPEALPFYADVGLSAAKLGEEAFVPLEGFGLEGSARKGLRKTVRKVESEGAAFELLPRDEVGPLLPELREISDGWLEDKQAREKGFSLGFFDEAYLRRTPLAVLRHEDRIVAYLNVLASGTGEELSADLMRYRSAAPASAMEYLFVRLMLWGAENGFRRFSLGMAPLAGLEARPLAPLWNRVGAAVFRYGEHFYNFRGLRAYKEKFDPEWEPRYLVTPGGLAFPRALANLATLVGGGVRGIVRR